LIVAQSFQFFSKTGIVGYYLINIDYISKVLCINRDKPEMKCDGKCHLKSQFRQQEEREQKGPLNLKEISETVLFFASALIELPSPATRQFKLNYPPYWSAIASELAPAIFHPPQAA
jgi:hypothetical protein